MPILFIFVFGLMGVTTINANKFKGCEIQIFDPQERYVLSHYKETKEECYSVQSPDEDGYTYEMKVIQ